MKKRQYDQFCPVALALDLIGERWALLIVRELLFGSKRFVDLEAGLPGIGTNTLTTRLDELESAGVLIKRRLPAPAASTVYELSEWGRDLEPIVYAIARWGKPLLAEASPTHGLQATWLGAALQAFFDRRAVRHLTATVELELPTGWLTLDFTRGNLAIRNGPADAADLRIVTTERGFVELLSGEPSALSRAKALATDSDADLLSKLIAAFPLARETTV